MLSLNLLSLSSQIFAQETTTKDISRSVLRIFNEANALTTKDLPNLYSYLCHFYISINNKKENYVRCTSLLDPIIQLDFILKKIKFSFVGRNKNTLKINQSSFSENLFTALNNHNNPEQMYVSKMGNCGEKSNTCRTSVSTSLSSQTHLSNLTCTKKINGADSSVDCFIGL